MSPHASSPSWSGCRYRRALLESLQDGPFSPRRPTSQTCQRQEISTLGAMPPCDNRYIHRPLHSKAILQVSSEQAGAGASVPLGSCYCSARPGIWPKGSIETKMSVHDGQTYIEMGASISLYALAQQYWQSGERSGKAASCLSWKVVRVRRLPRASAALALLRPRLAWNIAEQCQGFPRVGFYAVRPRVVPHDLGGTSIPWKRLVTQDNRRGRLFSAYCTSPGTSDARGGLPIEPSERKDDVQAVTPRGIGIFNHGCVDCSCTEPIQGRRGGSRSTAATVCLLIPVPASLALPGLLRVYVCITSQKWQNDVRIRVGNPPLTIRYYKSACFPPSTSQPA